MGSRKPEASTNLKESKAGAGGGFVFVGGNGFDEARDRERIADAAFTADEMQPAALSR